MDGGQLPFLTPNLISWRAKRIEDPVARLRYLQQKANPPATVVWTSIVSQGKKWRVAVGLLAIACLVIPGYKFANSKDRVFLPMARVSAASVDIFTNVWLVDKTKDFETYSN